jgi:biopolymer transport protein TolR
MAKRKLSSDINVVPYIDVMLVLLIIFMVTAPLLVQGIQVDLPEANAESMQSQAKEVYVSVDKDGQLFVSDDSDSSGPLSDEEFVAKITTIVTERPDQLIYVSGDTVTDYGFVAKGMALMQQAGARKIGFVTAPLEDAK